VGRRFLLFFLFPLSLLEHGEGFLFSLARWRRSLFFSHSRPEALFPSNFVFYYDDRTLLFGNGEGTTPSAPATAPSRGRPISLAPCSPEIPFDFFSPPFFSPDEVVLTPYCKGRRLISFFLERCNALFRKLPFLSFLLFLLIRYLNGRALSLGERSFFQMQKRNGATSSFSSSPVKEERSRPKARDRRAFSLKTFPFLSFSSSEGSRWCGSPPPPIRDIFFFFFRRQLRREGPNLPFFAPARPGFRLFGRLRRFPSSPRRVPYLVCSRDMTKIPFFSGTSISPSFLSPPSRGVPPSEWCPLSESST